MDDSSTFELVPVESADIPRLSKIHVDACLLDNAFKLYFETPKAFEDAVTAMLKGQIGEPTWVHVKAVDKQTGTLAAWASWETPTDDRILGPEGEADEDTADKEERDFDFPPGIAQFVEEDSSRWLKRITHRRRHMLTKAMFTDPSFWRRGIGSAMVRYGNQLADEANLPIFLWGSAFGAPIYAKYGFETVQWLDLDLRDWAPSAKGNDKGYGNYRFRYMVRLPLTLPPKGQ